MCPGGVAFLGEGRGWGARAALELGSRRRGFADARLARALVRCRARFARAPRGASRVRPRRASAPPSPDPRSLPLAYCETGAGLARTRALGRRRIACARARARPSPRGAREGVVRVEHRPVRGGHRARAARTRASRASSAARARVRVSSLARRSREWDSRTRAGPTGPGSGSRARSRAPSSRPPRAAAPSAEFPSRASRPRPVARVRRSAARAEAGGGRGRAEPSTWDEKCTRKRRARFAPFQEGTAGRFASHRSSPPPSQESSRAPSRRMRETIFVRLSTVAAALSGAPVFLSTALEGPGLNSRESR